MHVVPACFGLCLLPLERKGEKGGEGSIPVGCLRLNVRSVFFQHFFFL